MIKYYGYRTTRTYGHQITGISENRKSRNDMNNNELGTWYWKNSI
jgi:hypothetical protein